ncbi:MAG TPA: hypothetical protein VEW93_03280 [Acidimicrobiales bacterium]|nr:hypothetical protein [Acidimicrobiales bacterium]
MADTVTVTEIRRDVVTLVGPETTAYLQGQLSQDVAALSKGEVALSFVLQPQGKVDVWLRVLRTGDDAFRLDVDAGAGEALVARLQRFKLRTKTDIALVAGVAVRAVRGVDVAGGTPCLWPGGPGTDLLPEDGAAPPTEAVTLDQEAYQGLRIACGVPAMGAEITPEVIPAELGPWVIGASVSFTKGCYTGQELVARIDSRGGNVPRHLRGLVVAGPPPAPGTALEVEGRQVGAVTSAAVDAGGRTVALALVHRSVAAPAEVGVGDVVARVVDLPIPGP